MRTSDNNHNISTIGDGSIQKYCKLSSGQIIYLAGKLNTEIHLRAF